MLKFELEKLITSLSPSEKKQFRQLYCTDKQVKDYVILFDLLCSNKHTTEESPETLFKKKYPTKSFDSTCQYLFRVLTNMLIQIRIDQDNWYNRHYTLMKARLYLERSLPERSLKEIRKAKQQADEAEDLVIQYQASRMELTQLAEARFQQIDEQELVDLQMKARNTLLTVRQTHEHFSLYELLSHRISNFGNFKENNKKKLNDLILSELSLTTRGSQQHFESKKLHLLFQSFFFIHTGDYKSALKIFKDLNELIETHEMMWDFPPYDYLSALDGILDSLRSIHYYQDMAYFIDKAQKLASTKYPEHFVGTAQQVVYLYQLNGMVGKGEFAEAIDLTKIMSGYLLQGDSQFNEEKRLETIFYAALAHFQLKQWKKTLTYLEIAIKSGKNSTALYIYRACRLLYILLHSELDNTDFLSYEIRAYKRSFNKNGKGLETEKYVFKTIFQDPKRISPVKKKLIFRKWASAINFIETSNQDQELLKYFDFLTWIKEKLRS